MVRSSYQTVASNRSISEDVNVNMFVIHTHKKKILLLPVMGHMHLAEPGCLCTKQALRAGLRTRRRTDFSSQQVVWEPEVPPDHCCFMRKGFESVSQQMPGTQSQLGGLVGLVGGRGRKNQMESCLSGGGGA